MGARLASAMADYERAVKEKLTEVAGLQAQLSLARREGSGVEMGKEVERLKGEVRNMGRQLEEEREGRRRAELKAEQLKVDLGGMEVLVNNGNTGNDDSMVQLGLSGAAEVAGTNSSSLRIREELHRSLVTRDFNFPSCVISICLNCSGGKSHEKGGNFQVGDRLCQPGEAAEGERI